MQLHKGKEVKGYAKDGAAAYTEIGQMYSCSLTRAYKEEFRNEESERT